MSQEPPRSQPEPQLPQSEASSVDPQSVEGLFLAALAVPDVDQRRALDQTCPDKEQRRRVKLCCAFITMPAASLSASSWARGCTPRSGRAIAGRGATRLPPPERPARLPRHLGTVSDHRRHWPGWHGIVLRALT